MPEHAQTPPPDSAPAPQPPVAASDRLAWLFRRAGGNRAAHTLQQALRLLRQEQKATHG